MQYSDVDVDAVCIPGDDDGDESGANAPEKPTAQVADDEETGKVYEAWGMARGGLVNAMDAEQLGDMIDEYSPEWVLEAIHEANSSRNGRIITLRFPQVILERWKQEGFKAPRDRGSPDAAAADLAHKRQMAEQTRAELRKEGIPEDRIEAAIKAKLGGGV